jgi:DNA-directed RNA polymerase specialized sigma24 family protein
MTPEQFVLAYASFQKVVQALLRLGISYDEAIDVTQGAFLQAWKCRHQLKDQSRALPWIKQIAIHAWRDNYRQRARLTDMPVGFEPKIEPGVNPRSLDLHRGLARVDAGHREILQAILEGRTASELATGLTSVNALYQRMTRARRALHKAMRAA